jgi:tRNA nucleotidyltransferase/poly(A) polymerase
MPMSIDIIGKTLQTPQGTQAYHIVEKLIDAGHDAWFVGGCVRDMLLGAIPNDIDIGTSATPDEIRKIFPKCDETHAAFGSMRVSQKGIIFEITTFREDDRISDGRHPESVLFSTKEKDADRRDITINAIYFHPISRELFDPHLGEKDLHERLIRIIGDPNVRIEHDALRLLRVIRFRALIGGQYHPETFNALHKNAKTVQLLSGSRGMEEMEKMLMGPRPEVAFEDLWETDILEYFLPELHACKGVAQPKEYHTEGDVWNHCMAILRSFTEDHAIDVRLAALMHDIGKPVTFEIRDDRIHFDDHASRGSAIVKALLDRLQCTKKRRDKICWLVSHHMMMNTFLDLTDGRKTYWYYHPWFIELLQLLWLDIAGSTPHGFDLYERIVHDYNAFLDSHPRPPKPLLTGEEVMEILGIEPGERVGEILKLLYAAQIEKKITTKGEARMFIDNLEK